MKQLRVAVLAGEASGDQLGAAIVESLKEQADIVLAGVGGPLLADQGLKSLFDYTDLSVMGLAEILPRLGLLMRRISETVDAVEAFAPDIVLSIDAPDFAKRTVRRLRKRGLKTKYVHVVAPTVWAWRQGRAKTFAKRFDHLLCLFPFEPPYFERVGLKTSFIGHPAVQAIPRRDENTLQKPVHILVLPGSRMQEINQCMSDFCHAIQKIKVENSDIELKISSMTLPHLYPHIRDAFAAHGLEVEIGVGIDAKMRLLANADVAIAVSGTMGLELALAGVPHVVAYKMNKMTYRIVRRMVKIPDMHLANIILGRRAVPELIQADATPQACAEALLPLLRDEGVRKAQMDEFIELRRILNPSAPAPASQLAARIILDELVRLPLEAKT